MRLIASVMGLLAMLCIGFFIGGLIIGDPDTWGLGIGGFALCCIIGPVAQYISTNLFKTLIKARISSITKANDLIRVKVIT